MTDRTGDRIEKKGLGRPTPEPIPWSNAHSGELPLSDSRMQLGLEGWLQSLTLA